LAACAFVAQSADGWVQLTPAGAFKPRDHRPMTVAHWYIDGAIAARVIERFRALTTPPVFDYEHQTLNTEENGQPAPAAGFIVDLQWREGAGLYAKVDWNARAKAFIDSGEYRYVSPVFSHDKRTGEVLEIHMGALTNDPAIDGMERISLRAAARFSHEESSEMNLTQLLISLLALAAGATEEQIVAAVRQLKTTADNATTELAALKAKQLQPDPALFVPIAAHNAVATELAVLKAQGPDPATHAPIAVVESLKADIAALKAKQTAGEVDQLIADGVANGKLVQAQVDWAKSLGNADIAQLRAYLEKTPAIAALRGSQTQGKPPAGAGGAAAGELDDTELAVCRQLGITADQFKAARPAA
jgi:phage I-like protein